MTFPTTESAASAENQDWPEKTLKIDPIRRPAIKLTVTFLLSIIASGLNLGHWIYLKTMHQ
jgi:hypothetical protein